MDDEDDRHEDREEPDHVKEEGYADIQEDEREVQGIAGVSERARGDDGQGRLADVDIRADPVHGAEAREGQDAAYEGYDPADGLPGDPGKYMDRQEPLKDQCDEKSAEENERRDGDDVRGVWFGHGMIISSRLPIFTRTSGPCLSSPPGRCDRSCGRSLRR